VALSSLYDDLTRTGREPHTDILSLGAVPADRQVAEALGLSEGTEVVRIERLRWADEDPLAIMCNWLPADLASYTADELATHGLYELLRRSGVHIRIATQRIGARAASAAEARLLHERKGAPLLTMERTAYDDSGRAVELGSHAYRSETYSFEVTLVER
jgi:DNA-binding GntR family transcriptional regulator